MPERASRIPSYRLHKRSGQAVVWLGGRECYLGKHGTPESRAEYDRLVAEWLATGRCPKAAGAASEAGPTLEELASAYLDHAGSHYVMEGRPTTEPVGLRLALVPARQLYGDTPAREFGPLRLKTVRKAMIDSGLCRNEVNRRIQRIIRVFRWAVGEELIPLSNYDALKVVPRLRPGQAGVRESEPIRPVPDAFVDAIRPYVSRQVWAMIELQRLTGMRPGEARWMRTNDVDTSEPVWIYTPRTHKMQTRNYKRRIYLGPKAQEILRPWLRADPTAFLFQPRESMAEHRAGLRRGRRARARSARQQPRKDVRRVVPGEKYSMGSYRSAVALGIAKANREAERTGGARVPHWHPNQLRHNAATRLRREFGLDVARAVLGHRTLVVAEVYAEIDQTLAIEAMARMG